MIKVSICCLAFNHEPFIRQCLDGFVMQKTNFAFEILVHDDASKDKTANIIREYEQKYPEIIKAIYQTENQYSKGVPVTRKYNFSRAKGKYIAICEGDDYWTDQLKLQKQVDFLEENNDFGVIHTDFDKCDVNSNLIKRECVSNKSINNKWVENHNPFEEIIRGTYSICTATVVFKSELLEYYNSNLIKNYTQGDLTLWLTFCQHTKFAFINDSTSVYRIMEESASKSKDKNKLLEFNLSSKKLRYFFAKKYSNNTELITYASDTYNRSRLIKAFNQFNTIEGHKAFNNLHTKTFLNYILYFSSQYRFLNVSLNKFKVFLGPIFKKY